MLRSFYNAVSGMNTSRFWIDITGDNIANVNTVGFKAHRPIFQDVISQVNIGLNVTTGTLKSTTYGAGAVVDSTQKLWTIGNFKQTGINTDLAIQGRGLFILQDPVSGTYLYTRDGQFRMSSTGYMVNSGGLYLLGFRLNDKGEVVGTGLEPISVVRQLPPKPTSIISFLQPSNLNADIDPPSSAVFDPNDPNSYNYKYSVTIYDTLGNSYQADVFFKKVANNEWRMFVLSDYDGDGRLENLIATANSGGTETTADGRNYNFVRLYFDTNGFLIKLSDTTVNDAIRSVLVGNRRYYYLNLFDSTNLPLDENGTTNTLDSAAGGLMGSQITRFSGFTDPNQMIFLVGEEPVAEPTDDIADMAADPDTNREDVIKGSYLNQFSADFILTMEQDGYMKGDLIDVYVLSEDGSVVGVYSNGKSLPLYRVGLAVFSDPEELTKKGANLYTSIRTPTVVLAGSSEKVRSGMLEMSNVDIAQEFINLITAQRSYQANARVITTSNTVLDETVNLVR